MLRAAHSSVSLQEHFRGKQGMCSGYSVVSCAHIWVSLSKACGYTLPRLCLKLLSPHYNLFCSSPAQIPHWFVECSDTAVMPWCSPGMALSLPVKTSWCSPGIPLLHEEAGWAALMPCFSKAISSAARLTFWLLGWGTGRGGALCLNSLGTGPDVFWSFKILKNQMLSDSR